jgi:hypothetical protein
MFFRTEHFTIKSHYAPAEIVDRLTASVASDEALLGFVALFSQAQFIGQITSSSIRVKVNKYKYMNNAFNLVFTATIESTPTGSTLHCRIGLHLFSIVILVALASAFPLLVFFLIVSAISAALKGGQYWVH